MQSWPHESLNQYKILLKAEAQTQYEEEDHMAFLLLGCAEAHKWTWQPIVHGTNTGREAERTSEAY